MSGNIVERIRPWLLRRVEAGTDRVVAFQKLCGLVPEREDEFVRIQTRTCVSECAVQGTLCEICADAKRKTASSLSSAKPDCTKTTKNCNNNKDDVDTPIEGGENDESAPGDCGGDSKAHVRHRKDNKRAASPAVSPSSSSVHIKNPMTITFTTTTRTSEQTIRHHQGAPSGKIAGVATNKLLHFVFMLGTAAGHEIFYILFFPLLSFLHMSLAKRTMLLWGVAYYTGQALKDLLRLPRPPSPPALKVSDLYAAEYGMPSTHATGAVVVSFYIPTLMYQAGYDISLGLWLIGAAVYTAIVCASRVYYGAHTVEDIVAGLCLGGLLTGAMLLWGDMLDGWVAESTWVPLVTPLVAAALFLIYPCSPVWSESFGDTALILGVVNGGVLGTWMVGVPPMVTSGAPLDPRVAFAVPPNIGFWSVRCAAALVMVGVCRAIVKKAMLCALPPLLLTERFRHLRTELSPATIQQIEKAAGVEPGSSGSGAPPPRGKDGKPFELEKHPAYIYKQYLIEIPTKFVTYSAVSVCVALCNKAIVCDGFDIFG